MSLESTPNIWLPSLVCMSCISGLLGEVDSGVLIHVSKVSYILAHLHPQVETHATWHLHSCQHRPHNIGRIPPLCDQHFPAKPKPQTTNTEFLYILYKSGSSKSLEAAGGTSEATEKKSIFIGMDSFTINELSKTCWGELYI